MKYLLKNLTLAIALAATPLIAAPPPKYIDVDANYQQSQDLDDLNIQQGASMRLRLRHKVDGSWPTLTGNTARWEARQQLTNTSAYTATSNLTSNEAHFIQFDLNNVQTGTSLTNWFYSIILVDGGEDYPIGVGTLNVIASDFAGSSGVLVGSGYETNSVDVTASVSTINFSTGITAVHDGTNKLTLTVAGGSGDLTAVQVSGSILTVASGTGPIPIVGLTTAAVNSAESDPIAILPDGTRSMTADLQIGTNKVQDVTGIHFVPTNSAVSSVEGNVYWDETDITLALRSDIADAIMQVGQEFWMRAKKDAGETISNGDAVYISGASGERPKVARADSVTNSHVVGLATHTWTSNDGWVTMEGLVRDLDTSSYSEGDELFVSATPGGLTNVSQFVGQGSVATVTRSHASAGHVFVAIVHSELEPAWNAVSNTVTANALLGSTALQNISEDTSPSLGGNLDGMGHNLGSTVLAFSTTGGSGLDALNASSLVSGTVPLARLSGITSNSIATATDTAYRSGGTYTGGTNVDVNATVINLDSSAVASLALADSALQSEVQDIAAVVALDGDIGTGNITSAAGGTTLDMSSGKLYSGGGTVDISGGTGPALSGSAFSASIDATTGNQIVGWSVLTNQIALLAPAGTTNLAGLQDVADLSGAASGEVFEYNGTKWTNATARSLSPAGTNTLILDAYPSASDDNLTINTWSAIVMNTELVDLYNAHNTTTGLWTAPKDMTIEVTLCAGFHDGNTAPSGSLFIKVTPSSNGRYLSAANGPSVAWYNAIASGSLRMNVTNSQEVGFQCYPLNSGAVDLDAGPAYTWVQITEIPR